MQKELMTCFIFRYYFQSWCLLEGLTVGTQSSYVHFRYNYLISLACECTISWVSFAVQLRLLTNGFKLLKTGGSLVYSTCRWVISSHAIPIFGSSSIASQQCSHLFLLHFVCLNYRWLCVEIAWQSHKMRMWFNSFFANTLQQVQNSRSSFQYYVYPLYFYFEVEDWYFSQMDWLNWLWYF